MTFFLTSFTVTKGCRVVCLIQAHDRSQCLYCVLPIMRCAFGGLWRSPRFWPRGARTPCRNLTFPSLFLGEDGRLHKTEPLERHFRLCLEHPQKTERHVRSNKNKQGSETGSLWEWPNANPLSSLLGKRPTDFFCSNLETAKSLGNSKISLNLSSNEIPTEKSLGLFPEKEVHIG